MGHTSRSTSLSWSMKPSFGSIWVACASSARSRTGKYSAHGTRVVDSGAGTSSGNSASTWSMPEGMPRCVMPLRSAWNQAFDKAPW